MSEYAIDSRMRDDVDRLMRYRSLELYVSSVEEEIERINDRIESYNRELNGMPRGNRVADRVGDIAARLADARDRLMESMTEADAERILLYEYIMAIEEPLLRNIMLNRYVKGLTWERVASEMNETDESYVRKMHTRYLKKHPIAESRLFDDAADAVPST